MLRHTNKGAVIDGLYRQDVYELPVSAIREIIVNAVLHRSYVDEASIQVSIFDDRIEIDSPGMLFAGLSTTDALSGKSKCRNKAIAEAFQYMKIIEGWGTGLPRLFARCKEMGLPEPKFDEFGDGIKVTVYRAKGKQDNKPHDIINELKEAGAGIKTDGKTNRKTDRKTDRKIYGDQGSRTETETRILGYMSENPGITIPELADKLGLSSSGIRYAIARLRERDLLLREGSRKQGKWIVKQ